MSQPNPVSSAQLAQYKTQLETGKISPGEFYDSMESQGYHYAGWGASVARGDGISGVAALDYMKTTAIEGAGSKSCRNLTDNEVDDVRKAMAMGYLRTLQEIAQKNGGTLTRDVNFRETEDFHRKAFEANHLKIDNWTLKTPMDLIKKTEGEAAVEKTWTDLRNTGGSGPEAMLQNTALMTRVGKLMSSPDPEISRPAQAWIDRVPGTANFQAMERSFDVAKRGTEKYVSEVVENNTKRVIHAVNSGAEYINHAIDANPATKTVKENILHSSGLITAPIRDPFGLGHAQPGLLQDQLARSAASAAAAAAAGKISPLNDADLLKAPTTPSSRLMQGIKEPVKVDTNQPGLK